MPLGVYRHFMIDGLISAFVGAYFFLMGVGAIGKPASDPDKLETQQRVKPILKIGGILVFLFGLARIIGLIK